MDLLRKNFSILLVLFLYALSFFLRFYGILDSHPFWVDEFSSAQQARYLIEYGLSVFANPNIYFESHNITTYFLIGVFFKLFGQNEWAARIPFVVIGSLVPITVFILARYIFNTKTAVSASLLSIFSYFMISWSRQARGYVLLQLLVLITMYLYLKITREKIKSLSVSMMFWSLIILGILTHSMFYILLLSLFLDFIINNFSDIRLWIRKPGIYVVLILILIIIYKTGFFQTLKSAYLFDVFKANNFWYYHSFLWREYGLVTFLSVIGFFIAFSGRNKFISPIVLYIGMHLIFVNFFFQPYVSRYLLPIFPFLFIVMAYSLSVLTEKISLPLSKDRARVIILTIVTLFIIANGHKFANKPKKFYSANHDFREIALIDYHQIYNLVKKKITLNDEKTVFIDTWWDRTRWYLGENYPNIYAFRWENEPGFINGLPKYTPFIINSKGEKIIPRSNGVKLITNLTDLQKVIEKYHRGFIFIDDSSLPKDVIDYAQKNFKKELYLDHYYLDDNPYSIWPATLYSWGIN